jgi:hypothetical protein
MIRIHRHGFMTVKIFIIHAQGVKCAVSATSCLCTHNENINLEVPKVL